VLETPVLNLYRSKYFEDVVLGSSSAPEVVDSNTYSSLPETRRSNIYPEALNSYENVEKQAADSSAQWSSPQQESSKHKFLPLLAWSILWITLCLALGLGLGLGLPEEKHESGEMIDPRQPQCRDKPDHCIGGVLDSAFYSRRGAFNGSGVAVRDQPSEDNVDPGQMLMTVYFQHWSGDMRWMQLAKTGEWIGGSQSEVIATNAKNATPISAVSYVDNGTEYVSYSCSNLPGIFSDCTEVAHLLRQ
jgi:hypothetical protein